MALTKEQLAEIKEKLIAQKADTERQLELLKKGRDFGDDVDSYDEEADEAETAANTLEIEQVLKEKLARTENLLKKLEKGEYGVCEKCETGMGYEFLKENPDAFFCTKCMNNKENGEASS